MNLDELKALKDEYNKKAAEMGRKALEGEFARFFAENPDVKAVGWTQYTPHFNDGDPCVFRMHGLSVGLKDLTEEEAESTSAYEDPDYGIEDGWSFGRSNHPSAAAVKALESRLSGFEDLLEAAFGDGVKVVATPKFFSVTDYDHD